MGRGQAAPGLRVDAELNRVRIVEAASAVFREQGIGAPIDDVAKRAGVGVATLYRRFPTRVDLIAAAFEEKMSDFIRGVETALTEADPWVGFCGYVTTLGAMQSEDRGFCEVLTMTFPSVKPFTAAMRKAYAGLDDLIDRAKAAGSLRVDFVHDDLLLLLMANAGVIDCTVETAPRMSPRLVAYLLQAFAAPGAGPLPPPPSAKQMYRARSRLDVATDLDERRPRSKAPLPTA